MVVRLWLEKTGPGQTVWRGSIDRVPGGEQTYFQTVEGLFEKVADVLDDLADGQKRGSDGSVSG